MMKDYRIFGEEIALKAGEILLDYRAKIEVINQKDIQDVATNADVASEKFIIDTILKRFPEHGIISEEAGEINKDAEYKWIIDPLDGTKEFIRNIPQWNCSIALQHKNETIISIVYKPYDKTLYSSSKGEGSTLNGNSLKVSKVKALKEAFIYCYLPSFKRSQDKYDWAFEMLSKIGKKAYRLRSYADENTALCWLAQGGCEAYINLANPPKIHDIEPGLLIAKEAGAYKAINTIPLIVANNNKIYNEIYKLIKN